MQNDSDGKNLYFNVLMWALENQGDFTRENLYNELNIGGRDAQWIGELFFTSPQSSEPLIKYRSTSDKKDYFQLSPRGIKEAVNYLSLEEARKNSLKSNRYSRWSLGIAIVATLISTFFQLYSVQQQNASISLTLKTLAADQDPLFKYITEDNLIKLISANNIRLSKVSWFIAGEKENVKTFFEIRTAGLYLPLGQLKNSYVLDTFENEKKYVADYISCYQLSGLGKGIPVLVKIKYDVRGDQKTYEVNNLIYIKGDGVGGYYVDLKRSDANTQQIDFFLEDALMDARVISYMSLNNGFSFKEHCEYASLFGKESYFGI